MVFCVCLNSCFILLNSSLVCICPINVQAGFLGASTKLVTLPWVVYISRAFDPFRIFLQHSTCIVLDLKNVQLSCPVVLRIGNLLTDLSNRLFSMNETHLLRTTSQQSQIENTYCLIFYTCQTNLGDRWHEILRKTGYFLKHVERY